MGLFTRKPKTPPNYNDLALDDQSWLSAGESRYRDLINNHYGSPDTIAQGGDLRSQVGDPAAALYFYTKAIDTMHSIYVCTDRSNWLRQPSPRDEQIIDRYLSTLAEVRRLRPGASADGSVREVTHRLRTISSRFKEYGFDPSPYLQSLDQLGVLAPDVDVSGVFWN